MIQKTMKHRYFHPLFWVLCLFLPGQLLAEEETPFLDKIFLDESTDVVEEAFYVGGGGSVAIENSNQLKTGGGGDIFGRYTFRESISFEPSIGFYGFEIGLKGVDGDLFALPLLANVLAHSKWGRLSFYFKGGIGYQFNDSDDADLNISNTRLRGVLTSLGGVSSDIRTVTLPAIKVDVDIEDGFIITTGGGFDWHIGDNLYFNFEARYQFSEFDVSAEAFVPGVGSVKIRDEEEFDTVTLRWGLFFRL